MRWLRLRDYPWKKSARWGQGVVEYAGALVIAVGIVAIVLATMPDQAYEFLVSIQEQILAFLLSQVPA